MSLIKNFSAGRLAVFLLIAYPLLCVLGDLKIAPESYFSDKRNFFNQYFVKWAWGWTMCGTAPIILVAASILWKDYPLLIVRNLLRIAVGFVVWFVWVSLFNFIHGMTGRCTTSGYSNESACRKAGSFWDGYDISGHSFLLIYSALFIREELEAYWILCDISNNASWLGSVSDSAKQLFGVGAPSFKHVTDLLARFHPVLLLSRFIATFFEVLWLFMLVWTGLHFHTIDSKILGGFIAILSWFLTYRVWYQHQLSPGLPGRL